MIFNKIDFYGQVTLGVIILVLAVLIPPLAMLMLIPFGAWQVLSALFSLFTINRYNTTYKTMHFTYLGITAIYLALITFVQPHEAFALVATPPLVLAIFYFILTYKRLFSLEVRRQVGGFLPNVEF